MNAAAKNYDGVNKYIRITDIDEASSTYTDKDIVSPDGVLTDNYLVNNRDILLARTGASTGKSYLYFFIVIMAIAISLTKITDFYEKTQLQGCSFSA